MTKIKVGTRRKRKGFGTEFKRQALLRAAAEGVPAVAQGLGLQPAQLYAWRAIAQRQSQGAEAQRVVQSEQGRPRREVARLEEAVAFLKRRWRTSRSSRSEVRNDASARGGVRGTSDEQDAVCDITYIGTDDCWLCLVMVLDLYSCEVVGWSISDRMTATLVCEALRMALFARKWPRCVIVHSDRGSQYCSREYRALLDEHGLIASMSARGNYYDNAAMES